MLDSIAVMLRVRQSPRLWEGGEREAISKAVLPLSFPQPTSTARAKSAGVR